MYNTATENIGCRNAQTAIGFVSRKMKGLGLLIGNYLFHSYIQFIKSLLLMLLLLSFFTRFSVWGLNVISKKPRYLYKWTSSVSFPSRCGDSLAFPALRTSFRLRAVRHASAPSRWCRWRWASQASTSAGAHLCLFTWSHKGTPERRGPHSRPDSSAVDGRSGV